MGSFNSKVTAKSLEKSRGKRDRLRAKNDTAWKEAWKEADKRQTQRDFDKWFNSSEKTLKYHEFLAQCIQAKQYPREIDLNRHEHKIRSMIGKLYLLLFIPSRLTKTEEFRRLKKKGVPLGVSKDSYYTRCLDDIPKWRDKRRKFEMEAPLREKAYSKKATTRKPVPNRFLRLN